MKDVFKRDSDLETAAEIQARITSIYTKHENARYPGGMNELRAAVAKIEKREAFLRAKLASMGVK